MSTALPITAEWNPIWLGSLNQAPSCARVLGKRTVVQLNGPRPAITIAGRNCAWKGNEWLREGLQPPSSRIMVHIPLPPALATHTFANKMRHLYYGRFIMPWQCSSELSPGLGSHVLRHAAATWASDRKAPQTEKNEHLRAGCGWRQRAMPTIKIRCNDRTCHDSHYRCQDTIYHPECN